MEPPDCRRGGVAIAPAPVDAPLYRGIGRACHRGPLPWESPAPSLWVVALASRGRAELCAVALGPEGACATAPTLRAGQAVTGSFAAAGEPAPPSDGVPPNRAAQHFAVDVSAGQTLTAQTRCSEFCSSVPALSFVDGCAPPLCLPTTLPLVPGVFARAWRNPDATPRRVVTRAGARALAARPAVVQRADMPRGGGTARRSPENRAMCGSVQKYTTPP